MSRTYFFNVSRLAGYVRRTDGSQAAGGDFQEAAEPARKQPTDENEREDNRIHVRG